MPKVVIVCTSATDMDGHKTGLWLEELAAPYYVFRDRGYQVVIASIQGGDIPLDDMSLKGDAYGATSKKFLEQDDDTQKKLHNSQKLADVQFDGVDAIFLAGGHGACVDFVGNLELKQAVEKVYGNGKVVGAVCHGPVGLVQCLTPDGEHLVKGKTMTGFSDSEEKGVGLDGKVPFLLETKLKELGAKYEKGDDWASKICVDGNFVTGQNPQSSEECAKAMAKIFMG